jgi:hypothetical protein
MAKNLDLSTIFKAVTDRLSDQKDTLNEADTYNHDHGDHMVQIFDLIQSAVAKKSGKSITDQLEYAGEVVQEKSESGSGKLYAQGLMNAASNLSGSNLDAGGISTLVKSLLNVEETQQAQPQDNALGSLLSGLMGSSESSSEESSFGVDDLLQAGMAFFQSKQDGDSNQEAIMEALLAASPLGESSHRSQSGSLVASTIMGFAKSLTN